LTPEGNPAANVKISAYTTRRPPSAKYREIGSFASTRTDVDGCFRLNLLPSGPAAFWILPTEYALSTHVLINDKRGDLGTIKLERGNVIQGTVIDIKGKPVPGVDVEADGEWPNEFREAGLIGIGDSITRSVVTDSGGTFTIRALPAATTAFTWRGQHGPSGDLPVLHLPLANRGLIRSSHSGTILDRKAKIAHRVRACTRATKAIH
jgi:hypothetical protein